MSGPIAPIDQARAYVARIGTSDGKQAFDVAFDLVRGFELSDDEALAVMRVWNARCSPSLSDEELRDNVEAARRFVLTREAGYLLQQAKPAATPPQMGLPSVGTPSFEEAAEPKANQPTTSGASPFNGVIMQPVESGGIGGTPPTIAQIDSMDSTVPPGLCGGPAKASPELYPLDSSIGRFVDYCHVQVETPKLFLLAGGLTLMSILVNRQVCYPWGDRLIYPNLFQVCLGKSGVVRKSDGIQFVRNLIDVLCPERTLADFTSAEKLVESFHAQPIRAMIYSEGKALIDLLNSKYGAPLSGHMMRLYDCEPISTDFKRDGDPRAGASSATLIKADNTFLTVLVGITPEGWRMPEGHQVNGLMGRFEVLYQDRRAHDILRAPRSMVCERAALIEEFKQLKSITGPMQLCKAADELFLAIQKDNHKRLDDGLSPQAASNLSRMPFVILRVAMLYELSATRSLEISVESVELARRYVEQCHESYLRFAGEMTKGWFVRLQDRIMEVLGRHCDTNGICSYSTLLNRISTHGECKAKDFRDALEALAGRGLIIRVPRAGATNPDIVIVKGATL